MCSDLNQRSRTFLTNASFNPVSIATGQPETPYIWSIASTGGPNLVLSLAANPAATNGNTNERSK